MSWRLRSVVFLFIYYFYFLFIYSFIYSFTYFISTLTNFFIYFFIYFFMSLFIYFYIYFFTYFFTFIFYFLPLRTCWTLLGFIQRSQRNSHFWQPRKSLVPIWQNRPAEDKSLINNPHTRRGNVHFQICSVSTC